MTTSSPARAGQPSRTNTKAAIRWPSCIIPDSRPIWQETSSSQPRRFMTWEFPRPSPSASSQMASAWAQSTNSSPESIPLQGFFQKSRSGKRKSPWHLPRPGNSFTAPARTHPGFLPSKTSSGHFTISFYAVRVPYMFRLANHTRLPEEGCRALLQLIPSD